jgi:outer membrane immunogenic protein
MKKAFGLAVTAALMAAPALAAELAPPAPTPYYKAPAPVEPVCMWCGFYIGANVGGSWGNARSSFDAPGFPAFFSDTTHPDGVIGGGQLGYNWQVGNAVFGIESDIQGSDQRDSLSLAALATPLGAVGLSQADKENWFGTTRGRLGFAPGGSNWLLYGTGGVAYGDVHSAFTLTTPIGAATVSNSATRVGWTGGGGLEYMFLPRWSVKAEYLYMDLGSADLALPFALTQHIRFHDNIARVGINYRFGDGPIGPRD